MKKSDWWIGSSASDLRAYVLDMKGITDHGYYNRNIKFDGELARELMPVLVAFNEKRKSNFLDLAHKGILAMTGKWVGLALIGLKQVFLGENDDLIKKEAVKNGVSSQIVEDYLYLGNHYRYHVDKVDPIKNEITLYIPDYPLLIL